MGPHQLSEEAPVPALSEESARAELFAKTEFRAPGWLVPLLALLSIAGFGYFLFRVAGGDDPHPWRIYLQNWMLFTGIAQGAVIYTAAMNISKSKWSRPVRRMANSFVLFLPVAFLLSLPLYFVMDRLWPWVTRPLPEKAAYLNPTFFTIRGLAGTAILFSLSLYFTLQFVRPDAGLLRARAAGWRRDLYQRLSSGWRGDTEEITACEARRTLMAPILVLVYVVAYSFVAFDYEMSLDPHWYSTLFGGWTFWAALLSGVAATGILLAVLPGWLGLERYFVPTHRHDQGKMTFAFATFWMYLTWSQIHVIWYGKMQEDWPYLLLRQNEYPAVVIAMVACTWFVPFIGLLGIAPKKNPATLAFFSAVVLLGQWIQHWLVIVPSVSPQPRLPLGLDELLITAGFAGLFGLTTLLFLRAFPVIDTTVAHLVRPYRSVQPHP